MHRLAVPVLLFSLLPSVLPAQLATTDDGSQLLIATPWKLRGEDAGLPPGGIYRQSTDRWTSVTKPTNGTIVNRPFLSGDGSIVAYERNSPCSGSCMIAFPRSVTEFQGLTQTILIPKYQLTMSRNGRFLLYPGFFGFGNDFALQDLETGRTWGAPETPALSVMRVADDGSVIGLIAERFPGITRPLTPNRVAVWRPGSEPRELMQADRFYGVWISADAKRALVEVVAPIGDTAPRELWWIDIDSGAKLRIAQRVPDGSLNFLDTVNRSISNDGSRVLFRWPSENTRVWLWQNGAADPTVALEAAEGFSDAILSGNGRVIWTQTNTGRLLRMDVDAGTVEQILDALPISLRYSYTGYVPGSATGFKGSFGAPGLEFTVGDLRFPVVDDTEKDSVAIQIPWEMQDRLPASGQGSFPLLIRRPDHPFEFQIGISVQSAAYPVLAIREERNGTGWLKAALPDFSALVTEDQPAKAGSTIHAWLYNLGPLDRPVPTGAPGPSNPPATPLAGIACYLRGPNNQPPVRGLVLPFVAYAAGLVGVYQVDLTIPEDWPAGNFGVTCESSGRTSNVALISIQ